MKSRERVICALELEEPDVIPTFEMEINPVNIVRTILGREPIYGNIKFLLELQKTEELPKEKIEWINKQYVRDQYELYLKLDLDIIRFIEWSFKPTNSIKKINDEEWIINGTRHIFKGETLWRRKRDETILSPKLIMDKVEENMRKAKEDARNAQFPSLKYLKNINKEDKFILVDIGCLWFHPLFFSGVDFAYMLPTFLSWFIRYPDVVHRMMRLNLDVLIEYAKAAIDCGADGILTCNDFGYSKNSWISPRHFREFIFPNLKDLSEVIRKKGSFHIIHSDGNNKPFIEMFAEAGVDAYQSIDILGGMDLAEVKRKIGDKVCLIGNVNLQILSEGSPEEVIKDVERCIEDAAEGGGYIISSSGALLNPKLENLISMISYARKKGKYSRRRYDFKSLRERL